MPSGVYDRPSVLRRLARHLRLNKKSGCLEWAGCTGKGGYGKTVVDGKETSTHRAVWIAKKGKIPRGLFVLHKCDNRLCCNVRHLFLGTKRDNTWDMISKCRGSNVLTLSQVRFIKRSTLTQSELGRKFKVSQQQISKILSGKSWPHLTRGFKCFSK